MAGGVRGLKISLPFNAQHLLRSSLIIYLPSADHDRSLLLSKIDSAGQATPFFPGPLRLAIATKHGGGILVGPYVYGAL